MRIVPKVASAVLSLFATPFLFSASLYSFDSANSTFSDDPLTLGFVFTANSTFEVTSLGWFDSTGAGFQSEHTVGIFDSTGNLLVSTTLGSGTTDPLSGNFRYHSISPLTLNSGSEYTLAGTSGGPADSWTINNFVNGFTVNPHLRLEKMQRAFLTALIWFTPNLIFLTMLFTLAPTLTDRNRIRNRIVLPPNLQASCLCRSPAWRCSWFADSAVPVAFSSRTAGGHCQRGKPHYA
jgi:hypothetical protein